MAEGARTESVYTATYRGSNPLTAIFKLRACTEVRAFCLYVSPKPRGMRTTDRGSTTGAASWTDRARSERLPRRGEQSESIPLTAIFKKELVRKYGLLYLNFLFYCDFPDERFVLDLWLLHQTYYRLCKTALLPYLKRFRKVCISISR